MRHLYLHVPFCARVCPYCAFYVHQGGGQAQRAFASALAREIGWARQAFDLRPETLYLGGGTPSLLPPESVEELFAALPAMDGEVTMEVNPATVTEAKARAWKAAGINRISLGAQSFDADYLKLLGRDHRPQDIAETVALLRAQGFDNIGIDLMFALPGQPERVWRETLEQAIALQPEHISSYALTYEEDTPFLSRLKSGEWKQDEPREIAMFEEAFARLAGAGLPFYEVSNFARPGRESRHNRAYWLGAGYLGLGPSAYATVGGARWQNVRDTARYVAQVEAGRLPVELAEREEFSPEIHLREKILFGLRMREGVPAALLQGFEKPAQEAVEEGLAVWEEERLKLTPRGRLVADGVAGLFV